MRAVTWHGKRDVLDLSSVDGDIGDAVRDLAGGRGPDSVIDAVGMEAHDSPSGAIAQKAAALLPDALQGKLTQR